MDCARAIVQSGIRKVITQLPDKAFQARWDGHLESARRLFEECGVEVEFVEEQA